MKYYLFKWLLNYNLLSLRTSLGALQAMQALLSGEILKIAIDLVYIDIGLHNYIMIIRL